MTRLTADWLSDAGLASVLGMLNGAGHQAYLVGGCVRNALIGEPVHDIDIATSARPEEVVALAETRGLQTIPTGIAHGTVTVLAGQPLEITTYRRDVTTDGRRATVAFSADMAADAARRDFTINALYASADGTVEDPTGEGLADLEARRVRFIGDASARIAEDGLRVLRFFRFTAWYARTLDEVSLSAIAASPKALTPVSKERIGSEMRKLLTAPSPGPVVAAMEATGVLAAIAPGTSANGLPPLLAVEADMPPRWHRRLATLGPADWPSLLRLSKQDMRHLQEVEAARFMDLAPHALAERFGAPVAEDAMLLNWANGNPPGADWQADIALGSAARFPLSGRDLAGRCAPGPAMGAELERLRNLWVKSRFTLDRAALLAMNPGASS